MIVKTKEKLGIYKYVCAGDEFSLTISDGKNSEVMLREVFTQDKVIDYVAVFRFASTDGTCKGFHVCGIFANTMELPDELKNAISVQDLSEIQRHNFMNSCGALVVST